MLSSDDPASKPVENAPLDNDRDHSNLVTIDQLVLSYHGWERDKKNALDAYFNAPCTFDQHISKIIYKQAVFDGDRSAPQLQQLDALTLTYPDWELDKAEAEKDHYEYPHLLDAAMERMERKQQIHLRDRSNPKLQALDSMTWTYNKWQEDKSDAEQLFTEHPFWFDDKLQDMRLKQKIHDGDKVSTTFFDCFDKNWSFPGWEDDLLAINNSPSLVETMIKEMNRKQNIYQGDRSDPQLLALDALTPTLSYPGWSRDRDEAERDHASYPSLFDETLARMKRKQQVHDGDRSDANLQMLDSMIISYPGHESDKSEAENLFYYGSALFKDKLLGMKHKQEAHEVLGMKHKEEAHESHPRLFKKGGTPDDMRPVAIDSTPRHHLENDSGSKAQRATVAGKEVQDGTPARCDGNGDSKRKKRAMSTRVPKHENSSSVCVVCKNKEASHSLKPCNHRSLCRDCAKTNWCRGKKKGPCVQNMGCGSC
jgi:hypothetical protein